MSNIKRVTKKQTRDARRFANKLIDGIRSNVKPKYKFANRLVGSAKWNIILKDENDWWDLDYQLLLTKNSKQFKIDSLKNATEIKNDFYNYLNEKYKGNENIRTENSTTAITVIDEKHKFSVDFVIIRLFPENHEIIRRNNKDGSGENEFTWNELPKLNEAYGKFNRLSAEKKTDLIENYILPRKKIEKAKNDNDITKKSSSEVFIEEVNNYVARK